METEQHIIELLAGYWRNKGQGGVDQKVPISNENENTTYLLQRQCWEESLKIWVPIFLKRTQIT
jgi:hypothetical protein